MIEPRNVGLDQFEPIQTLLDLVLCRQLGSLLLQIRTVGLEQLQETDDKQVLVLFLDLALDIEVYQKVSAILHHNQVAALNGDGPQSLKPD